MKGVMLFDPVIAQKEQQEFLSKGAARYADSIVERVVKDRNPCVLVLPTGAGKSTVIPYAFIKAGYRIMISEPTVAMCSNVVNSFNTMFPSIVVGTSFERENKIPKDARLIVTSNGSLKKRLLGSIKSGGICVSIEYTDIIMLDEVHMGSIDNHIIVSLWYHCSLKFANTARMPRLLLSSATVDDVLFSRRFPPCVVLPPGLLTKTAYEIPPIWSEKDYDTNDTSRYSDIGKLLKSLHETRPIGERILVFLPGRDEMSKTLLASELKQGTDITLVTIWSESTVDDYKPIERVTDDNRLVVFATPSADAGLTINKLVHVIDSLLIKVAHEQPNGSNALVVEVASRQLSRQRMGRVGRTAPGWYYPMCTKEFYESESMPAKYGLEIHRRRLYPEIIELVAHGLQPEELLSIYNIDSLPETINQLLHWGLVRKSQYSGELYPSSAGKFLTQTEISSPRLGSALYMWIRLKKPITEGLVLTHLISGITSQVLQIPSFSVKPGESRGKLERMRMEFIRERYGRFLGPSDVHTAIRLWNTMIRETETPDRPGIPGNRVVVERWCSANAIQWKTIKNVMKSIEKTLPRVRREAIHFAAREGVENMEEMFPSAEVPQIIHESSALPIIRRLLEYVLHDQIAVKKPEGKAVYIFGDGTTLEPALTSGFVLQADPDSATPYPLRIVVIGRRLTTKGKTQISQFLDIDDPKTIANISTAELKMLK